MSSVSPVSTAAPSVIKVQKTEQAFLSLKGLHKSFGPYEVLHDVSLEMHKGEVLAIIGPSGSGKSTLLRCINQLSPPTAGSVSMDGVTIEAGCSSSRNDLVKLRRRIGMVFQSFNLFPHLTVLQNVSLAQVRTMGRSKRDADKKSLELLDRVGLANKAELYPARCSGGQQQRIAIARALALEPELMLFDEPTSALDPELGLEVLAVMKELANEGMSMIMVTHEMHFAETVSDRVVVMAEGRILEQGISREVMRNPQHERVVQFLRAVRDR
ncbi:amino acid ABC transporter ATP-binding protein [Pseudomonas trivialis]|uniref:Amino acid ABC transporter ATP-binding protein, PAAT family n=1 Tax=Pseudomonas trivialis TaxID=200450 RepID=A0A0R2ZNA1_9PSED|nr:amino acid ABC transporter ATP-binding protein [Pseudomonas trivialis]KRP60020.1 glutamine ABC transporter ATP-binding protein [Pseudomonas trivialis]SDS64704.1 amino acid ABC transporter ATP-binding protein, PAAT family [Pseudomonas trivialis]